MHSVESMTRPPDPIDETLLRLRHSLTQMARWGCPGFECSQETLTTLEQWGRPLAAANPRAETLEQIREDLGDCRRCSLSRGRTCLVFGEGDPRASLVFVGEGPGEDEDRSGRPFVGEAGQLLTRIIEAMKLSRDQVYICNVIKCRPPGNRNPEPAEVRTCRPFLERQIASIQPKVICALGKFAAQTLLSTDVPISRLRGRFHPLGEIQVMPTYHPAYLLRHPEDKRLVWEDVKKIMAFLGMAL